MQAIEPSEKKLRKELKFVRDDIPGILRKRRGRGFFYLDPTGQKITDPETLQRIKNLVKK